MCVFSLCWFLENDHSRLDEWLLDITVIQVKAYKVMTLEKKEQTDELTLMN